MNFQFGRISLQPETRLHRQPVFDVVMIGHTDKQAKLASLFANASMLKDMRDAGYSSQLNQLEKIKSVTSWTVVKKVGKKFNLTFLCSGCLPIM